MLGETISGADYFYTKDHIGSIREFNDSLGDVESEYSYDPYGSASQLQQSLLAPDFEFRGYYHPHIERTQAG